LIRGVCYLVLPADCDMTADKEQPRLYLDIDGVVLRRRPGNLRTRDAFEIAPHAPLFLTWAVQNFDVRWLSSRCQAGDAQEACHALRYALGLPALPADWRFVQAIPAVRWGTRKIDAIDLSSDFFWLDDDHGDEALAILTEHGKADRAIHVNVDRDPDALLRARQMLAKTRGLWRSR
jgi:hypothetical protein